MRYLVIAVLVSLVIASGPLRAEETETLYLSGTDKDNRVEWDFLCTAGARSGVWTKIPVPSNWELEGFGSFNYGHDKQKADEKGLYKYRFSVPNEWRTRRISIVFEGSMTDTEVSINGKSAGPVHQGGFYRFRYDITDLLDFGGPNLLSVTVSKQSADPSVNGAERSGDYWVFGGLYRPVYLEAYPPQYISRTAIQARADGTLLVDAFLAGGTGADRLVGQIRTLDGRALGQPFEETIEPGDTVVNLGTKVSGHETWTAETPNLYQLELRLRAGRLEVHLVRERFGFRTVELRPGDGIFVNGRRVRLKGVNRHSFWPDSGRTTSPELSLMDVNLIKEMNMNAVRMSHYPPDTHFLDACDTLGLYVLDELAGWQQAYGTPVGEKLVEEMVTRDVNHPSIIIWDNGNEGGWNRALDDDFQKHDPQKRPVIHPWERFGNTDTAHYQSYDCCPERFFHGKEVFFPTEFLHGLYDGGLGAGLEDYWDLIISNPLGAGGFLWAMVDEAVKRVDKGGVIDTDGNHAPDGLLGPYREKEASFFAVKQIWSPVVVKMEKLPPDFDGRIEIENRFDFTSLADCRFYWKLVQFPLPTEHATGYRVVREGTAESPPIGPWSSGQLALDLPGDWKKQDGLFLTARDRAGREIYTWTWMIQDPEAIAGRAFTFTRRRPATAEEDDESVRMLSGEIEVAVDKKTGLLKNVRGFSLANGPLLAAGEASLTSFRSYKQGLDCVAEASYTGNMRSVKWRLQSNGWLRLDYEYELEGNFDFLGVGFDYPEDKVKSLRWLGEGPYRVWKNRLRGMIFNVWTKPYNDTQTGAGWVYPEFKGYHANFYWAVLDTAEGPITVMTEHQNLYLRVFTPSYGPKPEYTAAPFPRSHISFLHGISPIGTKFHPANELGPQGHPNHASGTYKGTVYFYFGSLAPAS